MTVEGNWIIGAMQSTYPKISYEVVPMPVGPERPPWDARFHQLLGHRRLQ